MSSRIVERRFCFTRTRPGQECGFKFVAKIRSSLILCCLAGAFGSAGAAESKRVDINFQIRPLLSDRCFKCHGPDEKARKKKLRLDTREGVFKELDDNWAVVRPGDPKKSEMIRRIFAADEDGARRRECVRLR